MKVRIKSIKFYDIDKDIGSQLCVNLRLLTSNLCN